METDYRWYVKVSDNYLRTIVINMFQEASGKIKTLSEN